MNLRKQTIIALALIVFFSAACRKESAPGNQIGTSPGDSAERQHPEGGVVPSVETKFFKGSIGSALGLQMKLVREGENLTGHYSYQKVGTKIDLRGNIDKDSNVTLEEFDTSGKQTGVFKGVWKQDENGAVEIAGNWMKPNSDKKTAFSLHEQPIEFSSGAEIASRQIKGEEQETKI